jgi:hypothetical protein
MTFDHPPGGHCRPGSYQGLIALFLIAAYSARALDIKFGYEVSEIG